MLKKTLSVLLAAILLLSVFSIISFAGSTYAHYNETNVIKCINDDMQFVRSQGGIPYFIKEGTLYENSNDTIGKHVYVVSLKGTNGSMKFSDVRSIYNCILSGVSIPNSYVTTVVKDIQAKAPKGSNIVLIGHSLGGMVAQQLAANSTLKKNYVILNTVTMGSPYVITVGREGGLRRFADAADIVPYLSTLGLGNPLAGNVTTKGCGYAFNPDGAHNNSYVDAQFWSQFDCLGNKNGGAYIDFNV